MQKTGEQLQNVWHLQQQNVQVCSSYLGVSIANQCCRTSRYEGTGFADALGYVGRGDYLSDTVVIGGVSTKNMYFGYTSDYSFPDKVTGDIYTILGKILPCQDYITLKVLTTKPGLSLECEYAGPKCTDRFSS